MSVMRSRTMPRDVGVAARRDLARDVHEPGRDERLDGDAGVRVLARAARRGCCR